VAWPQNHSTIFTGLASKLAATVSGGLASNPTVTVSSSFVSKPTTTVSPGLASKPVVRFLIEPQNEGGGWFPSLGLKTGSYGFCDLGLKITTTVSWFGPQNHAGFGLSIAPQNRWREVDVGHALRSSGLLHVEASLARVFQSNLKTGGGTTTSGARGPIAEFASEVSSRRTGRCDGLRWTLLPYLCRLQCIRP
jgi:hypothetical protein